MLGYTCLTRSKQLQRLTPLLVASIVTLITTVAEAQHYRGPQIITYGEPCPLGHQQNLPYQIQRPLIPNSSPASPSGPYLGPPGGKLYCYGISAPPSQSFPSNVGFQLPVTVQQPVLPRGNDGSPGTRDPLQGRSYGIGIQDGPHSGPQNAPHLGSFDFGVQTSVPTPKNQLGPRDPSNRFNVAVQPGGPYGGPNGGPYDGPGLWGPLPIDIEHPVHDPSSNSGGPGDVPPKRLTGLTSKIDRLLIPACDLPMGG